MRAFRIPAASMYSNRHYVEVVAHGDLSGFAVLSLDAGHPVLAGAIEAAAAEVLPLRRAETNPPLRAKSLVWHFWHCESTPKPLSCNGAKARACREPIQVL